MGAITIALFAIGFWISGMIQWHTTQTLATHNKMGEHGTERAWRLVEQHAKQAQWRIRIGNCLMLGVLLGFLIDWWSVWP